MLKHMQVLICPPGCFTKTEVKNAFASDRKYQEIFFLQKVKWMSARLSLSGRA